MVIRICIVRTSSSGRPSDLDLPFEHHRAVDFGHCYFTSLEVTIRDCNGFEELSGNPVEALLYLRRGAHALAKQLEGSKVGRPTLNKWQHAYIGKA